MTDLASNASFRHRLPTSGRAGWASRLLGVHVAVLILTVLSGCMDRSGIAPSITVANIRRVRLGMSEREVTAILGTPYDAQNDLAAVGTRTLIYFKHLDAGWSYYPMLWIHLEHGSVTSVYAKRHRVWDSEGVYGLSTRGHWESRFFLRTFPRGGA